eukprot:TRINITY_DN19457_c0_g1_i1.p1 TRINITY_DN19457_c0_g1~~TRINITY_DN19457_c0_g1_i1.p1  ORF type:complete len:244 (+),score=35.89 TRINITY_DN19457_c0_g1_i1:64-732(+)
MALVPKPPSPPRRGASPPRRPPPRRPGGSPGGASQKDSVRLPKPRRGFTPQSPGSINSSWLPIGASVDPQLQQIVPKGSRPTRLSIAPLLKQLRREHCVNKDAKLRVREQAFADDVSTCPGIPDLFCKTNNAVAELHKSQVAGVTPLSAATGMHKSDLPYVYGILRRRRVPEEMHNSDPRCCCRSPVSRTRRPHVVQPGPAECYDESLWSFRGFSAGGSAPS